MRVPTAFYVAQAVPVIRSCNESRFHTPAVRICCLFANLQPVLPSASSFTERTDFEAEGAVGSPRSATIRVVDNPSRRC
jgi:hypothetical protein